MIRRFPACLLLAVALIPSVTSRAQAQLERPYDGLLERTVLQRVVDLQNARNAGALVGMLSDQDPDVRARAAFALASVQDSAALPFLVPLLSADDPEVRADAAFAIGQTGRPGSVLIGQLITEVDDRVRHELMQAAGKVGDAADLGGLVAAEIPPHLEWSRSLAIARFGIRGVISEQSVTHQIGLLRHPLPDVRMYAGYFFWRIRAPETWQSRSDVIRSSLSLLDATDPAAGYLALALSSLADTSDIPLIRRVGTSPDWRIRVRAVRALGAYPDHPVAREAVVDALDDAVHHVAISAAAALETAAAIDEEDAAHLLSLISVEDQASAVLAGHLLTALAHSGREDDVLDVVNATAGQTGASRAPLLGALAVVRSEDARAILEEAARSDDVIEAYAATSALARRWQANRLGGAPAGEYFGAFSGALRTGDVGLVYASAPALADSLFVPRGSVDVLEGVLQRLEAPRDTEAMLAILASLSEVPTREARAALTAAAEHPHDVVRRAARRHLGINTGSEMTADVRPIDWEYLVRMGVRPKVILETEVGAITIELYPDQAPQTVETITRLAGERRYDGVPFHRVVPDFVVQGGDFARGDGFGGPGFEIRSEFTRLPFGRGAMGMASAGKDTEGSQFFITHSPQPHLDGSYTAFGRVLEGMDVVDRIAPGTLIRSARVAD